MNFTQRSLSDQLINKMLKKQLYSNNLPISLDRLVIVELLHYDFNFNIKLGSMMILDILTESVIKIFTKLYELKFPINSIKLIDEFNGSDDESMQANNSSAFNNRSIAGTTRYSAHAYGAAIDLNPHQNPQLSIISKGIWQVSPNEGDKFINRIKLQAGMVENIKDLFIKYGFSVWGGSWSEPVDWMHFQLPIELIKQVSVGNKKTAQNYFNLSIGKK